MAISIRFLVTAGILSAAILPLLTQADEEKQRDFSEQITFCKERADYLEATIEMVRKGTSVVEIFREIAKYDPSHHKFLTKHARHAWNSPFNSEGWTDDRVKEYADRVMLNCMSEAFEEPDE